MSLSYVVSWQDKARTFSSYYQAIQFKSGLVKQGFSPRISGGVQDKVQKEFLKAQREHKWRELKIRVRNT